MGDTEYKNLVMDSGAIFVESFDKINKEIESLEKGGLKVTDKEIIINFFREHNDADGLFIEMVNKVVKEFPKAEMIAGYCRDTFAKEKHIYIIVRPKKYNDKFMFKLKELKEEVLFRSVFTTSANIHIVTDYKKIGEEITPGGCDGV